MSTPLGSASLTVRACLIFRALVASALLLAACGARADEPAGGPQLLPPPGIDLSIPQPLPPVEVQTDAADGIDLPAEVVVEPEPVLPVAEAAVKHSYPMGPMRWLVPGYWFRGEPWEAGVEFGLNGTQGQNEAVNLRVGSHLRYESDAWKLDSKIAYNRNNANNVETQNNAILDARVDRILGSSDWTLFSANQLQYDEFQAFDLRLSTNVGIGYQFFDNDKFDLTGRCGLGVSHEFGSPDDSVPFEALFGLDAVYRVSPTQRLRGRIDYFPEWEDFARYRIVSDCGWEIDLDTPADVSLQFSIIDRYDSTPNGVEPNQLDYAVLMIWGL